MIRRAIGAAVAMVVILVAALPAEAGGWGWRGPRVGVFVGPGFWGPPLLAPPFWYGLGLAYPYYRPLYAPPVYSPPVVVERPAPVYTQQQQYYWYYCRESGTYYPYVKECPAGWMKVVPPSELPGDPGPSGSSGTRPQ